MQHLDFSVLIEYLPAIMDGLFMTIKISVMSIILGSIMGVGGALCRTSKSLLLRSIGNIYVEWIRNTPLLIQILFIYFGLGVFFNLSPWLLRYWRCHFFPVHILQRL